MLRTLHKRFDMLRCYFVRTCDSCGEWRAVTFACLVFVCLSFRLFYACTVRAVFCYCSGCTALAC